MEKNTIFDQRKILWQQAVNQAALEISIENIGGKSILPFIYTAWRQVAHEILKLSNNYSCRRDCFLSMSADRRKVFLMRKWRLAIFYRAVDRAYRRTKMILALSTSSNRAEA